LLSVDVFVIFATPLLFAVIQNCYSAVWNWLL